MPLDPKYADLPWIAHDQPDVFESSELPEVDQHMGEQEDTNNEDVEKLSINANESRKVFAGKQIDSGNVDFSDSVAPRKRLGYGIDTSEYHILPDSEKSQETPLQTFQRLQAEIRQLVEDVKHVTDEVKADETATIKPNELAEQAALLEKNLTDFHIDKVICGNEKIELGSVAHKRLIHQIESYQPKKKEKSSDGTNNLVYELCYQPELAKTVDQAKVATLDQRMQRIEALLGNNPVHISSLTADTTSKTLLEAVERLNSRSTLLESSHLDQIESRLVSLQNRLQSITDKKEVIANADTQNKIAELYEITKKWNAVADALPGLVSRLTAIDQLHTKASQFSQSLTYLDSNQQQVSNTLKAHQELLENLKGNLKETLAAVKSSCESVETRMQKLGK